MDNHTENSLQQNLSSEESLDDYTLSLETKVIFIFLGFAALVITIANILVLVLAWLMKSLRTKTNLFLLSLAASDLLTGVLVVPLLISCNVAYDNETICMAMDVCQRGLAISTILHLACAVSERYIKISSPFKYVSIVTVKTKNRGCVIFSVDVRHDSFPGSVSHGRFVTGQSANSPYLQCDRALPFRIYSFHSHVGDVYSNLSHHETKHRVPDENDAREAFHDTAEEATRQRKGLCVGLPHYVGLLRTRVVSVLFLDSVDRFGIPSCQGYSRLGQRNALVLENQFCPVGPAVVHIFQDGFSERSSKIRFRFVEKCYWCK